MLFLAALLLPGCGSKVDTQKLQTEIRDGLKKDLDLNVSKVTCPAELAAGKEYECVASALPPGEVPIVVKVGDSGAVSWETKYEVVNPTKLLAFVRDAQPPELQEGLQLFCDATHLAKPGNQFTCRVMAASGDTRELQVTIDQEAKATWKLVEPAP